MMMPSMALETAASRRDEEIRARRGTSLDVHDAAASNRDLPAVPVATPPAGLLQTPEGLSFEYCGGDAGAAEAEFLFEEIFVRRSYFRHGVELSRTCSSPVVIDVGANIGLFSLHVLASLPQAHVIAVEPAPAAFVALERNVSAYAHAHCERLALRHARGQGQLSYYPSAPGESSLNPRERAAQQRRLRAALRAPAAAARGSELSAAAAAALSREREDEEAVLVTCPISTLSDLIEQHSLRHVDLIKIDCEGDELLVLRGIRAQHWPLIQQLVLEVHDAQGRLAHCTALLRRHGFVVTVEPQRGGVVEGYEVVIPPELELYYVYATRATSEAKQTKHPQEKRPRAVAQREQLAAQRDAAERAAPKPRKAIEG